MSRSGGMLYSVVWVSIEQIVFTFLSRYSAVWLLLIAVFVTFVSLV